MTTQMLGVTFQYSHTIGRREFTGSGFREPLGIARGGGDLLYLLNRGYEHRPDGKRVTICTVGEDYIGQFGQGATLFAGVEASSGDGSIVWATSIALDKEGNVYMADEWLNRVSIFTRDGDWIGKWGTPVEGDGEINRPSGLAFDKDDILYLVDSLNNRIQKFTKDGEFLSKWGWAGSDDGEFNMPWGIDIDSDGNVYVADWRNDRIQKFTPDGRFLMEFGIPGTGDGHLTVPVASPWIKKGLSTWLTGATTGFRFSAPMAALSQR